MSPSRGAASVSSNSFPRVSGDEPQMRVLTKAGFEFSPRERG